VEAYAELSSRFERGVCVCNLLKFKRMCADNEESGTRRFALGDVPFAQGNCSDSEFAYSCEKVIFTSMLNWHDAKRRKVELLSFFNKFHFRYRNLTLSRPKKRMCVQLQREFSLNPF